jgi:hypothetical protein
MLMIFCKYFGKKFAELKKCSFIGDRWCAVGPVSVTSSLAMTG